MMMIHIAISFVWCPPYIFDYCAFNQLKNKSIHRNWKHMKLVVHHKLTCNLENFWREVYSTDCFDVSWGIKSCQIDNLFCLVPSRYLNEWWLANWTISNKLPDQNAYNFVPWNAFGNVVCKMCVILSTSPFVFMMWQKQEGACCT